MTLHEARLRTRQKQRTIRYLTWLAHSLHRRNIHRRLYQRSPILISSRHWRLDYPGTDTVYSNAF